jgi:hypothetical protein
MLHHAAHIVRPLLVSWLTIGASRRTRRLIVVIGGNHAHGTVVARRAADHRLVIDGAGQHKTVVIVGMFADQVDAARRLNNVGGRVAKFFSKQGLCFLFQTHF